MSDPVRVALVAEGPTDRIIMEGAIRSMLGERTFMLKQIQPEGSLVFGEQGTGWCGVYRWCKQAALRGNGHLSGDRLVFSTYDLLLLHLDADVAENNYKDCGVQPAPGDAVLPCQRPCPPAFDTTNALRVVLLSWCGETVVPGKTVVCVPSKSTEAWVLAALFPEDPAVGPGLECLAHPESRFGQQPISKRIRKSQRDYQDQSDRIESGWPTAALLGEAARFQADFLQAVQTI